MRADKFLSDRFSSRTKAAEAIDKGLVLVNGKPIRSKDDISSQDEITFVEAEEHFVSNGGYKLARAVKTFSVNCQNKTFVDIGASTGGFTDCLLQNGAKRVYAVDVGESLLDERIKKDSRVVCVENTNARYLSKADFSEPIDGIVADVSFISLRLVLPVIANLLSENGEAFTLIKPQFECEGKNIGKSGIVRSSAHKKIVERVLGYCKAAGLYAYGIVNAPVRKRKNVEYIVYLKKIPDERDRTGELLAKVEELVKKHTEGILE